MSTFWAILSISFSSVNILFMHFLYSLSKSNPEGKRNPMEHFRLNHSSKFGYNFGWQPYLMIGGLITSGGGMAGWPTGREATKAYVPLAPYIRTNISHEIRQRPQHREIWSVLETNLEQMRPTRWHICRDMNLKVKMLFFFELRAGSIFWTHFAPDYEKWQAFELNFFNEHSQRRNFAMGCSSPQRRRCFSSSVGNRKGGFYNIRYVRWT